MALPVVTPTKAGGRRLLSRGGGSPKTPTSGSGTLRTPAGGSAAKRTPWSSGSGTPRTPASGSASPRTPRSSGSGTPRTPASAAPSLLRRHSGTPKRAKQSGSPVTRLVSSCPRSWAPPSLPALRAGAKGSPLRRERAGSDTPAARLAPKRLVRMASYKTRTPPQTKALPLPRIGRQGPSGPRYSKATNYKDLEDAQFGGGAEEKSKHCADVLDSMHELFLSIDQPDGIKYAVKGGKPYGNGKPNRFARIKRGIERSSMNGLRRPSKERIQIHH
ncbi:hypothetical protein ACP70R_022818 [Stipagrostis hirtigluma subsp. patula]